MTKVYPSSVIPDRKEQASMHHQMKKNYRPNNFLHEVMAGNPSGGGASHSALHIQSALTGFRFNSNDTQEEEQLEIELTGTKAFYSN